MTILEVSAAPVAIPDAFTTAEDTALVVAAPGVLANDTNVDGPSLRAIPGSGPSHGIVVLNGDGSFRYTPQGNYNGSDSFRYSVWDGARQSPTVAVTLTVTPVNDAPSGITLFGGTVPENVPLGTQVGWFTTQDPETTTGFTYTLSGEGADVLEMLNVNYLRTKVGLDFETKPTYTLHVRTTDSGGLSYERDFAITVTNLNEAPVAADDSYAPTEDVVTTIPAPGLLINDSDVDRDNLVARLLTGPGYGTLTLQANGSFTYVPVGDYCGSDTFTYQAWDGFLASAPATINLTVASVNDPPSFVKGADQTTLEDCGLQTVSEWATAISAGPVDEAGQVLDFIVTNDDNTLFGTQPTVAANGTLTFGPASDANGSATVTIRLRDNGGTANDGVDTSASQTFTITVTPVNDSPVSTIVPSISGTMNVGNTLTADPGTWSDAIDSAASASLTYTYQWVRADDVSGTNAGDIASATATTYVLSNADVHKYLRMRVMCTDSGVGLPATQSVTLVTSWTSQVVNRLPVITEGASVSVTMDEDGSPLAWSLALNATDADGDTPTWSIATAATHGTATASGTGSSKAIGYTPAAADNGPDSFVVQVSDAYGGTDTITVNVTVTPVNDMPSFTKGTDQTVLEDCGAQTVALWATAISAGPANESPQVLTFTVTGNTNPALFSVVPVVSSIGTLTYAPAPDANGEADVTLTLTDDATRGGAALTTAPQTFKITVTAANDVPSFTRGADQTVLEDCGAQTVALWATAISKGPADEAGQILHFDVSNGNNALFSAQPAVSPTGILTYTPVADMNGSATVTLHIHDNGGTANGGVDTSPDQTFTITVTPVNDPPVNTALPAISGIPHIGRTLTTTDGAWNDLVDTSVSGGTSVPSYVYQWQRSTDGGSNFTPVAGATGSSYLLTFPDNLQQVRVQVTCSDTGVGLPASQSTTAISLPVTILNAAPVVTEGPVIWTSCDEDESPVPFNLTLHATDSDDIDTLTWHIVTPPAHGSLALPAPSTGSSTTPSVYHPAPNWNGVDSFTLRVDDGLTGIATITVTVAVNPRNDAPVNTVRPSVAGSLFVNHEVRALVGSWNDAIDTNVSGISVLSYTYQWLRASDAAGTGLVLIPGATASTYVVLPMDEGMYLAVRVTCTDGGVGLPLTMSTSADSAFLPARYLDMMPPTIELPDSSSWPGVTGASGGTAPSFAVNQSPFDFHFMVEDNRRRNVQWRVAVNGVETSSSTGIGTIDYQVSLTEGTNRVNITAVDEGGNRAERHFTITLDTHAPVVTLKGPLQSMVTGTTLNVEGTITDELSGVRSLTIDGTEVVPYLDGTFKVSFPLKRGLNTIMVETLDNAGNRGFFPWVIDLTPVQQPHVGRRMDLTIDRKVMVVDGASVAMDVAPVILESRTLLPLRALVEELGGTVAWNAMTRQVTVKARGITTVLTIGKNTATVNGKSTLIDPANSKVAPVMLGSRTFLPLRFIAEQLGLGVAWDAPTRTVTITWEP